MSNPVEQAKQNAAAKAAAEREVALMYAQVAATAAGSRVLADISNSLANPDFECAGLHVRGEGFLARIREAARIDVMVRRGRTG